MTPALRPGWQLRKSGAVYAQGPGPHGYSPETLRSMRAAGYRLYIAGKVVKL